MKKEKIFALEKVTEVALFKLDERYFGGFSPSDFDSDWTWGYMAECCNPTLNVYGIWLRFKTICYCISFEACGFKPVFDGYCNIIGYERI